VTGSEANVQQKKQIRKFSVAPLFHEDALKFVWGWKESKRVHESWIEAIEQIAACEPRWPRHMALQGFGDCYWQAPNLAAALLNFLRERWASLEKQKHGKLKKFLARNSSVPWDDSFKKSRASIQEAKELLKIIDANDPKIPMPAGGRAVTQADLDHWEFSRKVWEGRKFPSPVPTTIGDVAVWELEDTDIANAFEKSPGGYSVSKQTIHDARRQIITDHRDAEKFSKTVLDADGFLQASCKPRRRKKRLVRARK
jgi:hypothetical protein